MTEDNVIQFKPRAAVRKGADPENVSPCVQAQMKELAEAFNAGHIKGFVCITVEHPGSETEPDETFSIRQAIDGLDCSQVLALQGALIQLQSYLVETLTAVES